MKGELSFDTYVGVMLRFIDPDGDDEQWLEGIDKAEKFLHLAANRFKIFDAGVYVSQLLPYPEFVLALTGIPQKTTAIRLFELFWQEHSDLKFSFGDWKPGDSFPLSHLTILKKLYLNWHEQRKKMKKSH